MMTVVSLSVIQITTCGATGRIGPTVEQCAQENNRTDVKLIVPTDKENALGFSGIQRWIAPRGEYYTLVQKLNESS